MKYLILLLISFNTYAIDYKIEIKDYKTNKLTHGATIGSLDWINKLEGRSLPWSYKPQRFVADYPTKPISEQDLNDHKNIQCWDRIGPSIIYRDCITRDLIIQKFEAAYKMPELDKDGKPTGKEIEVVEIPEIKVTEYEIPAKYKISITDVTVILKAEKDKKEAKELSKETLLDKLKAEDLKLDEINKLLRDIYL